MKLEHYYQASTRAASTGHPNGAALVIVLALVVLLTVLAVAVFSRATADRQVSFSSSNESKAELLARGALAVTIGDLKQEIAAGSTQTTVSGVTIYNPKPSPSPSTLIPALVGSTGTGGLENLVKRSAYQQPFYANPTPSPTPYNTSTYPPANRAANVSTLTASLNGRSVSAARWNKPLLIAKQTLTSTDPAPVGAFTAPDWVLIARDGSNPTAWNSNLISSTSNSTSVIGRYAYTVYDEGGLIDMNVAGYPTVSTAAQIGRKGAPAYADLKQIPGISNLTAGRQTKFLNNIAGWRNFASGTATGNLGTFDSGTVYTFASGAAYNTGIVSTRNGFMAVSNTTLNNGQSDRKLASRQELIALLIRGMASTNSDIANLQVALQYFGTFSRELNRPSWKPYTPTGSTIDYATLAKTPSPETSTAINRDLTAVRDSSGNQLVKTRFPLSRIDTLQNPSNTNIQSDFGLKWVAAQNHWDYVGASGITVQSTIKALDQVASENRQPNFFEILKAVILSGSVGLGSSGNTFVAAESKYSNADYQIMQMGTNIIDAWDVDNVPTFINFGSPTVELAGVENLPYLNKLVLDFWVSNNGNGGAHDQVYAWLVPSLWNPHQNAAAAPSTQDVRFAMTTGSVNAVVTFSNGDPPIVSSPVPNAAPYPSIEVRANAFTTACPPVPLPTPMPASASPPGNENGAKVGLVTVTTKDSRLYDGLDFGNPIQTTRNNAWKIIAKVFPFFSAGTNFEMQVNINGTWKPYQAWKNCNNGTQAAPLATDQNGSYKDNSYQNPEFVSLDPRTIRFGVWGSDFNDAGTNNDGGAEDTMDQRASSGGLESVSAIKPQPSSAFTMSSPKGLGYLYAANTSATDYYKDLDGVKRPGDSPSSSLDGTSNTKTIMYGSGSPPPVASPTPRSVDRPQILSAPFQSVAELGQVFRDQPWKTLNFTSAAAGVTSLSADAGLLDAFTLQESSVVAGKTSLNTRQTAVLTAILSQATANLTGTTALTVAQRDAIVAALKNLTLTPPAGQAMLVNKGELVTRLASDASVTGLGNKEARECVMRAFSDSGQTRTWNLMIDVIAQSGRYPPNAANLAQFVVEGEKRYWLHVAIDRFTGEIIDQQLEAVYE